MLSVGNNQLTGPVPSAWSALPAIARLAFYNNMCSGPLPTQWSSLTSLLTLQANDNRLTGSLPTSWSALTKLRSLWLEANAIVSTLPPAWSSLAGMQYLALTDNAITGALPPAWSTLGSDTIARGGNVTIDLLGTQLSNTTVPSSWPANFTVESSMRPPSPPPYVKGSTLTQVVNCWAVMSVVAAFATALVL